MNNKDFEPIRVRIMQEAYELADRNDSEGYNAIKAMCGDVQRMLLPQPAQEPWRESASDYERGYVDGMQKQMQSSVDKAVNRMAQPAQEPVAHLCGPDENGLFGLPTEDKACKDCFPVYRQSPQPAQEPVAWMYQCTVDNSEPVLFRKKQNWAESGTGLWVETPLYTTPPQPAQEPWRESASDYERGVIDGRQMQAQSSVDKAVNAMTQRPWVGLTKEDLKLLSAEWRIVYGAWMDDFARDIEAKLKEKNT